MSKSEIVLDAEFKIEKSGESFTLMHLSELTSGKRTGEQVWKSHGYHGSMVSAMRGYIRHSIDTCETVIDVVKRIEVLEEKQRRKK